MANLRANKIVGIGSTDAGVVFQGDVKINSQGYMYFPTGNTEQRGRGRGLIVSNYIAPTNYKTCEYITIQSLGNSVDFGDASAAVRGHATLASSTRAVSGGGYVAPATVDTIEYFTIATTGNGTDFGDLSQARSNLSGFSSNTRGVFAGGSNPTNNILDYVTIASAGNATDFGDLICNTTLQASVATSNSVRGLVAGGDMQPANAYTNTIQHVTITTTGNASDFGDMLTTGAYRGMTSDSHGGLE